MAHYETFSLSQPSDKKDYSTVKADKMLIQENSSVEKGMEKKFHSDTVGELEIPQENKSSISPSSSLCENLSENTKKKPDVSAEYISKLNNIRSDISENIDRFIDILQKRKVKLLSEIDDLITEHLKRSISFESEQKRIESLITQANQLDESGELREQITRSSRRSLCKHAFKYSCYPDVKLEMKDLCNELENLGRISLSKHPNYSLRSQHFSFPVKHGKGEREIGLGAGVAVANQLVYVVDSENNSVQVFSLDGSHCQQMKGLAKMNWPFGICVVGELVYLTQQQSHTVCLYSAASGELLVQAGGKGSVGDKLQKPSGLTVYESEVFVCDQGNHRVQVFDAKNLCNRRKVTSSFFKHPTDCQVWSSELLVLSMSDPCLHAFSLDGRPLRGLISWGPGKEVTTSCFFTVDADGNFILSEIRANCLKVFNRQGSFLSKISCDGAIHQPSGIGLDSEGQIYLVHKGHRSHQGMILVC